MASKFSTTKAVNRVFDRYPRGSEKVTDTQSVAQLVAEDVKRILANKTQTAKEKQD